MFQSSCYLYGSKQIQQKYIFFSSGWAYDYSFLVISDEISVKGLLLLHLYYLGNCNFICHYGCSWNCAGISAWMGKYAPTKFVLVLRRVAPKEPSHTMHLFKNSACQQFFGMFMCFSLSLRFAHGYPYRKDLYLFEKDLTSFLLWIFLAWSCSNYHPEHLIF